MTDLNYAPAVRNSHRYVRKFAPWVLILAAIFVAEQICSRNWFRVQFLLDQRRCMNYSAPPNQTVFDEDPLAIAALSGQANYTTNRFGSAYTTSVVYMPPCWQPMEDALNPPLRRFPKSMRPTEGMAFLHRRTSPGGHERLVNVEVSSGDSFGGPEIHWMVVIPGSFAPQAQMRSGQLLELQRNSRTEMFKVMAGQPDAADASHFTIDYYFNGQRGTIDGWLCNDDTVRLQPQVGYVRENPNGLPRRWYIDDYASHTIFVSQPAQRLALPLVPKLAVSGNSTDPCCTYSPDGKLLAVSRNQCVHLWDLAAGQWVRRLDHAKNLGLTGIAFSHDGHLIAAMDYSGGISIWDVHTGQALPGWNGEVGTHNGTAFYKYSGGFCNSALAFGPDDKTLLAAIYGEYNKSAYLWDLTSGRMVQQFTPTGVKAWVRAMVLSPDGKTIAICSDGTGEDGRGYWSADAGKWIRKLPQQYSLPLDFSSDGKMLLALNSSHEVVLIDAATDGVLLKRLIPDGGAVGATNGGQSGQICPNGKALALRTYQYSALNFDSMHGAVAVWDLPKADTLWLLSDPSDDSMANKSVIDIPMTSLSFSPDGQFLATVGGKGAVLLWQLDKRLAKP